MKELRAQLAHVDPSRMAPAPQLMYFFLGFRSFVLKSGSLKFRMMIANLGIQNWSNKIEGDPLFPGKRIVMSPQAWPAFRSSTSSCRRFMWI